MTPLLKLLLPVALVAAGVLGAGWMMKTAPQVAAQERTAFRPLVEVRVVPPLPRAATIRTQGEVRPERRIALVAEVAARVVWTADDLHEGTFFAAGDPLLRLDPTDYRLALARADAGVSQAAARLALASAESDLARRDWEELGQGEAPPLALRQPQLDQANADHEAALAARQQAQRDLDRCEIRAPFACRMVRKQADLGQFLGAGSVVAMLDSTAAVEVLLPLSLQDMQLLGLGLGAQEGGQPVQFHGTSARGEARWSGYILGTLAGVDPTSRMAHVLARVEDPYHLAAAADGAALVPGMFIHAVMEGLRFDEIYSLPRSALREGDVVLLVDEEDRLHQQAVDVLQRTADEVLIRGGLQGRVRICLTPLATVVEGMHVRLLATTESGQ